MLNERVPLRLGLAMLAAAACLSVAVAHASLMALDDPVPPEPVPNAECPEDVPEQELVDELVTGCGLNREMAIQAAIVGASPVVCDKCERPVRST